MPISGHVTQRVRPLKLGFLVEPNNKAQLRESIRLASSIWGGAYCPIVPIYKQMPGTWRQKPLKAPKPQTVVTGYLDAFDPDLLVQLSTDIPQYIKDYGLEIIKPEAIWEPLTARSQISPQYAIGMLEILKDVFDKHFKFKAKYPIKVVVPHLPRELQLFWASVLGDLSGELLSVLRTNYYEPLEIQDDTFTPDKLDQYLKSESQFPRRLTQYGLHLSHRAWRRKTSAFYLDATKTEDIIDYWNLRALGNTVIPIPRQLASSTASRSFVSEFLRQHRIPWPNNPQVCSHASIVRSRNTTTDEITTFAKDLDLQRLPDDPSDSPFFSLQHWYPRIWDEWAREKDGAVPADIYENDETIELPQSETGEFLLRPKLPSFADTRAYHGTVRCANDLSFHTYGSTQPLAEVFPRSSGNHLMRAVAGRYRLLDEWRIGQRGLVRLVKDVIPNRWQVPPAQDVFFAWLEDRQWKPELSSPGRIAKQIHRRLGGFVIVLKNEKLLKLLEHMNGGAVQRNGGLLPAGANVEGTGLLAEPRELAPSNIRSGLEDENSPLRRPLDYLLEKGVFQVGLRLQCPHCTRRSWFATRAVADSFACPRCLSTFPAIGNVEDGRWFYRTAGPFSIPQFADGAFATLLALEFFNDRGIPALKVTPAFSFTAQKAGDPPLEADFAMLWQQMTMGEQLDGVAFGECKTYGQFADKDFARMSYIAKTFPGAVLVFATLRTALTTKEVSAITRIAKKGRAYWKAERPRNPVLILTGRELLSDQSPPYCWKENAAGKQFEHVHDLLGICNATQQLYLGLAPWEEQWAAKWKKRDEQAKAPAPSP